MKSLVVGVLVGMLALVAGAAVAGLPTSVRSDIVVSDIGQPPGTSEDATTTAQPTSTTTTPPTTLGSSTTASTDTQATDPLDRSTTQPAVTEPTLVSEASVRVVVANAAGTNGLAARFAELVRGLGYVDVQRATATENRPASIVYWSPGREGEARRLAEQLGIAAAQPVPSDAIVVGNSTGDVWALIGADLQ